MNKIFEDAAAKYIAKYFPTVTDQLQIKWLKDAHKAGTQFADPCAFAEWCSLNGWSYQSLRDCWFDGVGKYSTTDQLYEIFKTKTP